MAMPVPDEMCRQNITQQEESTKTLLLRDSTLLHHLQHLSWVSPQMIHEVKQGTYSEQKHLNNFLEERISYQKQKRWDDCNSSFFETLQNSINLQIQLKNDHILTVLSIERNEKEILKKHTCSQPNECNQILLNYFIQKTEQDTQTIRKNLQLNAQKMQEISQPRKNDFHGKPLNF